MPVYIPGIIFLLFVVCLCSISAASLFNLEFSRLKKISADMERKTAKLKLVIMWLKNENRNMSGVLSELLDSEKLTKHERIKYGLPRICKYALHVLRYL